MDGSAYSRLGDAVSEGIRFLFIVCCVFVPLGLWKLFDILVWVTHYVHHHVHLHLT